MSNKNRWLPMPRFLLRQNALKLLLKNEYIYEKNSLEIGFGAGEILKLMANKGALVTGFDFSKEAIETAKTRLSTHEYREKISITNDETSLQNNYYDYVLAFEVLEHIEDDESAFDKWLKYLKPGGSLIISVPAHMSKWCKNDVWAGHIRRYEKHQLLSLCKGKNITVNQLWNYGFPLTIALDKLLNNNRKGIPLHQTTNSEQKIELTKKSGIERENKFIYRVLSNDMTLYPFYLLQRLFFNRDLGSGYIMRVTKNER